MPNAETKTAVIIVCWNQLVYTKICLSSILKNVKLPYKLFLVNNASTDGTKEFIDEMQRQYSDKIISLHSEKNIGFSGGNNIALKQIQNNPEFSHVLLLNNDVLVPPRFLENLLKTFSSDKYCGMVVPVSNYAGNRQGIKNIQVRPESFDEFSCKWEFARNNYNKSWQIGMAIGLCMLMKREVLDKVGLLDDRFFCAWEDNDFSLRVINEGYKIHVAQSAFLYHFGSKSIKSIPQSNYGKEIFETNKKKFYDKWAEINKLGEKKKICGMLRVKNGGEVLKETLSAHSRLCDEIVVFDDHSTDNTEEICKSFPKVVDYYKSEYTNFNEARDRNQVLQMAKSRNPDWIFSLDHDEIPEESLIRDIQTIVSNPNPEKKLYCFQICNIWNTGNDNSYTKVRTDAIWNFFTQGRLFKNEPNQEIKNSGDDGLHAGSHPYFPQENIQITPYRIKHYGNADPQQRLKKYMWYTATDKNKDRNAILGGHYEFYKDLYARIEEDRPENQGKELGEYQFTDKDFYRHIVNENTIALAEWKENITLSAAIIVKRSDYEFLPKCIDSIKDVCDEIVIVRTEDNESDEIPSIDCDKVKWYYHKWNDSFSEARNFALSKCTGDWALRIDADEIMMDESKIHLKRIMNNDEAEVILMPIMNYMKPDKGGNQKWVPSKTARAFKRLDGVKYSFRVHEEINNSITELGKTRTMRVYDNFPVPLQHYGYLKEKEDLWKKYDYYKSLMLMDIKENPKSPESFFNLGVECFQTDLLDDAEMYYRKSIELGSKDWKGSHDLGVLVYKRALLKIKEELIESLKYYNVASEMIESSSDKTGENLIKINKTHIENLLRHIEPKERSKRNAQ